MNIVAECTEVEDTAFWLILLYKEGTVGFISNHSRLDSFWHQRVTIRLLVSYLHPSRTKGIHFGSISKTILFDWSLAI